MQALRVIKKYPQFFIASVTVFAGLLFLGNGLFFFDEDIFVTNLQSSFMQQDWQRSYIIKQVFKAEYFFFGKNPAGYHITGAVLHIGCGVLAAVLMKELLKNCARCFNPQMELSALFIFYLLFLITPVHSEPICYILAQGILVFTVFAILTILYFIKAITENHKFLAVSLLFFAAALLCYEISWMIPFINLSLFIFYRRGNKSVSLKGKWYIVLLYFIVLTMWFYIKTVFISKSLVADYGNVTLLNIDFLTAARNSALLFVRNYIPPVKTTVYFSSIAVCGMGILTAAVFRVFKKQPSLFSTVLLLAVLSVLAFAPTSLFGIDSHDSESERYVYFSSVFAIMLLSIVISVLLKTGVSIRITVAVICFLYVAVFSKTISSYKLGGQFSKKYLTAVNQYTAGLKTVYTVNQPSQFRGALMLRALTRLPEKVGENYTVLNEYMKYLFQNDSTAYITFSAKELSEVPAKLTTVRLSFDSCGLYFPETIPLAAKPGYSNGNVAIAALRNDSLYIFR